MQELLTEADVINLVGYETPFEFEFISEGIITFKTMIPKIILSNIEQSFYYKIELFVPEDVANIDFFRVDNFENFLSKYQIHELTKINLEGSTIEQLYFREYDEEYYKQ